MVDADTVRFAVGIVGNVLSFCLFIAPGPTFWRILKHKSTEEFHPYPYLATMMNCMMWIFYGLPLVHPHSLLVITINSFGLACAISELTTFFIFTGKKYRLHILGIVFVELLAMAGIVCGTLLGLHTHAKRSMVVGIICVVFGIIMYGAPLSIMLKVIKTKSAEFLPKWLCLAGFLNGICWTIYALLKFDPYIMTANGTGSLLGLIQLLLIGIYWNKKPQEKKKPPTVELVYNAV